MKVRIGRRRSRADAMRSGARSADGLALAPAFSEGRWDVPDDFNFTRDVFEALASDPKRRALMFLGHDGVIEPRTFLQLAEGTARWAALLRERGVRPGDRVLVVAGKTPHWLEVMLAGLKIGAVTVPCPETLSAAALDVRVSSSGAQLVVASGRAEEALSNTVQQPDVVYIDERRGRSGDPPPDTPTEDTAGRDIAFILSTSGTSGDPIGVAHTHASTFAVRVQTEHWLDAGPGDAVWCTADTGNALAVWNVLLGPWSRGAETILHQGDFDPRERLDLIDRLGTTILCQTPSEYAALIGLREFRRYRPRRLRRLVSTGDTLDPDVIAAYEEVWGMTIHEGYGQAETAVVVANGVDAGFRAGSVGLPIVGHEVAVIDDQGNLLGPGVEGDLALHGRPPSLFSHYWDAPEETKASFRGDWYVTGDIAATDEDGFVWLLGRADDVITSRGQQFGSFDIERALRGHDAVVESAVVGIRDLERGGQFVRAFVVLDARAVASEQLEAELRHFVGSTLPEYKVPREIEFVDELPKTPSGNVRRAELRERTVVGRPLWETPAAKEPEPVAFVESIAVEPEQVAPVEPEPVVFAQPEPAALVEPQPEPEPTVPIASEPVAFVEPEPVVVEPELVVRAEPEPVVFAELESPVVIEPELPIVVDPEPPVVPVEPEPAAVVEPEPDVREPEPAAVVEPEPVVVEPEPVPQVEHHEIVVVEPAPEPEPAPERGEPSDVDAKLPYEPLPSEPLPDYIVVPESERPPAPEPTTPDVASLGLPPVTSFPIERDEQPERKSPSRPGRHAAAARSVERNGPPSTGEPGDEVEEVDWMQGLSTRLSAYSLTDDDEPSASADDDPEIEKS